MGAPRDPRPDDDATRPGRERLDESLGFVPLDETDEGPTSVRVPAARPMAKLPSTGETRRPTDRGLAPLGRAPNLRPTAPATAAAEPPPLPRPAPAPPEAEPVAPPTVSAPPLRSKTDPQVLVDSGLFRAAERPSAAPAPATPQAEPARAAITALSARRIVPADQGLVHVRSPLMQRRSLGPRPERRPSDMHAGDGRADTRTPDSRPDARPVIRAARDPKALGRPSSLALPASDAAPSAPPPLPSARSLLKPAQREPTDSSSGPSIAARLPTDTGRAAVAVPSPPPAHGPAPMQTSGLAPGLVRTRVPTDPGRRVASVLSRDLSPRSGLEPVVRPTGPDLRPAVARAPDAPRSSLLAARPIRTETAVAPAAPPRSLFRPLSLATLVLLFEAIALPTAAGPPWELVLRPNEASFLALAGFALVLVLHLLPLRPRLRAAFATAAGLALVAVACLALQADASRTFDAQPALAALFEASPAVGLALVVALVTVPAGLFLRRLAPRHLASTALIGFGAAIGLAVVSGIGGALPEAPITSLFASVGDGTMLGDRVAAGAALPAVVALAAALAFTWPALAARRAATLGLVFWGLALLPMLVLALFAAKAEAWIGVLGPVKLVTLFGASALYLACGLAHVFAPAPSGD